MMKLKRRGLSGGWCVVCSIVDFGGRQDKKVTTKKSNGRQYNSATIGKGQRTIRGTITRRLTKSQFEFLALSEVFWLVHICVYFWDVIFFFCFLAFFLQDFRPPFFISPHPLGTCWPKMWDLLCSVYSLLYDIRMMMMKPLGDQKYY